MSEKGELLARALQKMTEAIKKKQEQEFVIGILQTRLDDAEKALRHIAHLMVCDPNDMKELDENFCVEQEVLNTFNEYFEKYKLFDTRKKKCYNKRKRR